MNIEVWIASHLDCEQRNQYLKELCLYLTENKIKYYVSVSGLIPCYIADNIKHRTTDGIKQFDHLSLLYFERINYLTDEDKVIFCDDDDMLLPSIIENVKKNDCGFGFQIRNISRDSVDELNYNNADAILKTFDAQQIQKFKTNKYEFQNGTTNTLGFYSNADVTFNFGIDHSGTWAPIKILKQFFEGQTEKFGYLADRRFFTYLLQHYPSIPDEPTVLYRKWGKTKYWISKMVEDQEKYFQSLAF